MIVPVYSPNIWLVVLGYMVSVARNDLRLDLNIYYYVINIWTYKEPQKLIQFINRVLSFHISFFFIFNYLIPVYQIMRNSLSLNDWHYVLHDSSCNYFCEGHLSDSYHPLTFLLVQTEPKISWKVHLSGMYDLFWFQDWQRSEQLNCYEERCIWQTLQAHLTM